MPEVMHDGGAPPPVRVQPAQLRRTGAELRQLAGALAAELTDGWTSAAAAGGGGWAATAAAVEAAEQWRLWLDERAADLRTLGERFTAAATAYQRCDQQAATRCGGQAPW